MLQKLKKNSKVEQTILSPAFNFKCAYCDKTFVREYKYVLHECREKYRYELLHTILGQKALHYYETWHKMCNRVPPHASTFLVSTYFKSFVDFAEFVRKIQLPNPKHYIRIMIEKNIQPSAWHRDDVYITFIEIMDNAKDPKEHIDITLTTIFSICEKADIDITDFFVSLTASEITQLIRQRKISPWVLLNSSLFKKHFLSCTLYEQEMLETVIRPDFWKAKFEANPDGVKKVRGYLKELGF